MTDAETRVREAFARVRAPEELKARTLAAIEARRADGDERAEGSRHPAPPPALVPAEPVRQGRRTGRRGRALRIAVAACVALVLFGTGAVWAVATPTAYVGIDVNPSIELAVNRFDGVVGARSYNEDGAEVLDGLDVVGMGVGQALGAIGDELDELGYLTPDATVSVTVSCDDEGQYGSIESASRCLEGGEAEVSCSHASSGEHHAASDVGMGVGRWRVWRALVAAGVDLSAQDAADMSLAELVGLAQERGVSLDGTSSGHAEHHGEGHH